MLGLHCCTGFSLATFHCSTWASHCGGFCSIRDLLRLGIEPVSSSLAGRVFTTEPMRKPRDLAI